MLYQKLLLGTQPYFIDVRNNSAPFQAHRHPEFELSYCLYGSYCISVENQEYLLQAGELAVIAPMAAHGIPAPHYSCKKVTIELGPTLLGEHFHIISTPNTACTIYRLTDPDSPNPAYAQAARLLAEIVDLFEQRPPFHDLLVKGNMYQLGAALLQLMLPKSTVPHESRMRNWEKIEKALDAIYNYYYEPLNIEQISADCGYSKSNFCKIFKTVTGDTFHNVLNRHRIEIACLHLKNSTVSVEKLAQRVGFSDSKSFCRVFKNTVGESAGAYRKRYTRAK